MANVGETIHFFFKWTYILTGNVKKKLTGIFKKRFRIQTQKESYCQTKTDE